VSVEAPRAELFGHPRGLTVLATTHMWERFSFFGMQALLMLYMTKYLLLPQHARDVLGLGAFRAGLVHLFGPMTDLAAQTFGIYSGLIYITPLIGAWLGDRVFGKRRVVAAGCLLMSAGHLAMASESMFLPALALLILGAGGVIGNMYVQVGALYSSKDQRRTRAFGIYAITLNTGSLIAPLAIGTLGEKVSWHWGFGIAGIGMLIGMVTYLAGQRDLPPDAITRRSESARLTRADWRRIGGLLGIFVPYVLYITAAYQAYGIMFVWADTAVDRNMLGWEVPVTWINIADGLLTISGIFIAVRIWKNLAARGGEPHDIDKLPVSFAGNALAFFLIAAAARLHVVPVLLWIAFYLVFDFTGVWNDVPLQAIVSRDAPKSASATMMSVYLLMTAVAYFLGGWMGRFYEPLGPSLYWALLGLLNCAAAVYMALFRNPILKWLEAE
jgi:proton-dependent oligopeptide transporter, POT family